jgi:hypothetical protein
MAVHRTKADRVSKGIRKKLLAAHLTMFSIAQTLQWKLISVVVRSKA